MVRHVLPSATSQPTAADRSALTTRARDLLAYAHRHGYGRADLIQLIQDLN